MRSRRTVWVGSVGLPARRRRRRGDEWWDRLWIRTGINGREASEAAGETSHGTSRGSRSAGGRTGSRLRCSQLRFVGGDGSICGGRSLSLQLPPRICVRYSLGIRACGPCGFDRVFKADGGGGRNNVIPSVPGAEHVVMAGSPARGTSPPAVSLADSNWCERPSDEYGRSPCRHCGSMQYPDSPYCLGCGRPDPLPDSNGDKRP
jgi:hypothetical protein